MSLREMSPRSVTWYGVAMGTGDDTDEALSGQEVLALRTMKALEDASIRAEIARVHHQPNTGEAHLPFRLPRLQARPA